MVINLNKFLNKHYLQIKKGGIRVLFIKFFSLLLIIPSYLISIPISLIIIIIKPLVLIRFKELHSSRIGHFSADTELYCCEQDAKINLPNKIYKDIFYFKKFVCNKFLARMWKRKLIILPNWLLKPLHNMIIIYCKLFNIKNEHEITSPINSDRDIFNLYEKFKPHIEFSIDEENKGKSILKQFGLSENSKFISLVVRDSGYLNRYLEKYEIGKWDYHSYRNGDIDNYILAAEELASRGYYVFRLGTNVLKPIKSSNPKIIDYSNSKLRSEFMDIYISAKCHFCLTTGVGIDGVSSVFRRPIACVHVPLGLSLYTNNKNHLLLTKHHINKLSKKELTISEIFSSNVALSTSSTDFLDNDVELVENTSEEIKDFAIEMDQRLNNEWKDTNEDKENQKKFWQIFEDNLKKLNTNEKLHGKIYAKFSSNYLRKNKDWIK